MNKKVFKTVGENEQEIELAVIKPSPKQQVEAHLEFSKAWKKAEESGSILRRDIDEIATKRGLWNDEKREKVEEFERKILELEKQLRGGANSCSNLDDAKNIALAIKKLRNERMDLIRPRLDLDGVSCENFADLARTNYLVASTVVYNSDGKNYFNNVDDFIAQSNNKVALDSAIAYYELNSENSSNENFEDQFLKKYGFVDDKNRLINKNGHLITEDGKLIDSNGRYVDDSEEFVDVHGNKVDDKGNYLIEWKDFENV